MMLSATSDVATTVHWAGGRSEAALYPPLEKSVAADVAIVGAGFMGLSAALHLAQAGRDVVVLDAAEPGAGASGRNAAHVLPGWAWRKPEDALKRFGATDGAIMNRLAASAPRKLFELIRQHDIPCDARPTGHLSIATTPKGLQKGIAHTAIWTAAGAPATIISADDVRRHLDVATTTGGWIFHDGGTLNPLALARGLAATAVHYGANIHGGSQVRSLTQLSDGWKINTAAGSVTAKHVILAMNAYGQNLWPGLTRAGYVIPCAMLASQPLQNTSAFRWPGVWNIADDKTVFGGVMDGSKVMLSSVLPSAGYATPHQMASLLRQKYKKYFPTMPAPVWDKCWIGHFMLTSDGFPKIVNPAPGLLAGFGCNGAGIAMAPALGRSIAQRILLLDDNDLYPLSPLKPAPFHKTLPWAIHNIFLPLARLTGA